MGMGYGIQHGFYVMVLNFGARSHFSFIHCMFYNVLCLYSTATKTTIYNTADLY